MILHIYPICKNKTMEQLAGVQHGTMDNLLDLRGNDTFVDPQISEFIFNEDEQKLNTFIEQGWLGIYPKDVFQSFDTRISEHNEIKNIIKNNHIDLHGVPIHKIKELLIKVAW